MSVCLDSFYQHFLRDLPPPDRCEPFARYLLLHPVDTQYLIKEFTECEKREWHAIYLAADAVLGALSYNLASEVRYLATKEPTTDLARKIHEFASTAKFIGPLPPLDGRFALELNRWVNDPSEQGNKIKAAFRVRESYANKDYSLDLAHLGLTSLPPVLTQMPHLRILGASGNKLSALPLWLENMTTLTRLFLNHNQLTALPGGFRRLTQLETLWLNHNQFTSPPFELSDLTALKTLWLNDNNLYSLPPLDQLTSLTSLRVHHNPRLALSLDTIKDLPLREINLKRTATTPDDHAAILTSLRDKKELPAKYLPPALLQKRYKKEADLARAQHAQRVSVSRVFERAEMARFANSADAPPND